MTESLLRSIADIARLYDLSQVWFVWNESLTHFAGVLSFLERQTFLFCFPYLLLFSTWVPLVPPSGLDWVKMGLFIQVIMSSSHE